MNSRTLQQNVYTLISLLHFWIAAHYLKMNKTFGHAVFSFIEYPSL